MDLDSLASSMDCMRLDGVEFYAHLTTRDKGDMINGLGIIIDDDRLFSAVNSINEEFYIDPHKYIETSLGSPQTRGKEIMVVVASGGEKLVQKSSNNYVIPSENIVGYLDLSSEYFISNDNSLYEVNSYTIYDRY